MAVEHPKKLGKYEILSVLGKGGMGIVYKARDVVIDRVVAIKTIVAGSDGIDQEQVRRLLQEARSAGRLHHPNIATVFDYGEEGGISYIVLEYAEGVDLGQVIAANQPMPFPAKIDLIAQICHGLGFAHDNNVVHRDLKPANVRLTPQGIAKIVDFGLARFDDTHLTKTGFISGTIAYMSPERMSGATGKSDDIFALGAVAYEILTYQRAFAGASAPEVMFKIMTQTPPPPSSLAELPPQLDRVILQCLDREPANRFATAYDFATAIEEVCASPEVQQFLASPERSEAFLQGLRSWTGKGRRRHTSSGVIEALSSSSGRVHAGDVPTASAAAPPTQVLGSSDATTVVPSSDATEVVSSSTATHALTASQSAMTMVDTAPPTRVMSPTTLTDAPAGGAAPTEIFAPPAQPKRRSPAIAI
ncbi:MAG TPA: protein kinase, partial [Thermoanaerobaculia bacterium]|nr:protein kinase [Thermoanaerobaculia bacterium]